RLYLVAHVYLRGGIFSDEHDRKSYLPAALLFEFFHFGPDVFAQLLRKFFTVYELVHFFLLRRGPACRLSPKPVCRLRMPPTFPMNSARLCLPPRWPPPCRARRPCKVFPR